MSLLAKRITLLVICLYRATIAAFFLAGGDLDLRYLTYVSYVFVTAFFVALLRASRSRKATGRFLLLAFPIVFNLCVFVGVAIVVIVQLHDWIFTRTTVMYGGSRSIGDVHTGDWVLHQLPVLEVLVVALLFADDARREYTSMKSLQLWGWTALYKAHLVFSGAVVLGLYFSSQDFNRNYPIESIPDWLKIAAPLVLSSLFGSVLLKLA